MLCAQVFLSPVRLQHKGANTASAVSKTGHYYFAAFSSSTRVDLRAFSRSNRDWSFGGVAGMVLARRSQCDNSCRGADLVTNRRFGSVGSGEGAGSRVVGYLMWWTGVVGVGPVS